MNQRDDLLAQLLSRPQPAGFPEQAVLPDYDELSIARVQDVVCAALGLDRRPGRLVDVVAPDRVERILLVLLDGLGYRQLGDLPSAGDFDRVTANATCVPLTTVFPSTTVAALTTYSTGLPPATHGMLGYRLFLREVSSIVNMIQLTCVGGRSEAHLPDSFQPDSLLACPTLYERLAEQRAATHVVLPRGIAASGLSRLLYRGATSIHPCLEFSDMLVTARQLLSAAKTRTLVTVYWPGLDAIAHARGHRSDAYVAEAASIAAALRRELRGRVKPTLLLVCSDHGFTSMAPTDYVSPHAFPELRDRCLFLPVGEPRASYLFLRPEKSPDPAALPTPRVQDELVFLDADSALSLGLFGAGATHPEARARLGDLVVVSVGRRGLRHSYPDAALLPSMHGGLTADEMVVPLLAGNL